MRRNTILHLSAWAALSVAIGLAAPALGQTPAPGAPGDTPVDAPGAKPGADWKPADGADLFRALEGAGDDLRALAADIRYDRVLKLKGDRHVRDGTLFYVQTPAPAGEAGARPKRAFAVRFETLYVGNRKQDDPQVWVFDGLWLVEKRPAEKRYTRRQIAREGEDFDPLRIGEGPMPLPIGQKADDVLNRYDVTLLEPAEGLSPEQVSALPFLKDSWQARLLPKAAAMDGRRPTPEDFKEIRLWYQRGSLLPRMAKTVARSGDESFVVLLNVETMDALPAGAMDDAPPAPDAGWMVQEIPLDGAAPGAKDAGNAGGR